MSKLIPTQIEDAFSEVFLEHYRTVLEGGHEEPFYRYSEMDAKPHRICYRHDFIASALHEVAHWCIAGKERRKINDYGYWYSPDGREASIQSRFYKVEALPQAIEKFFHQCLGSEGFHLSIDNLGGEISENEVNEFRLLVAKHFEMIQGGVMPKRAKIFSDQLKDLRSRLL